MQNWPKFHNQDDTFGARPSDLLRALGSLSLLKPEADEPELEWRSPAPFFWGIAWAIAGPYNPLYLFVNALFRSSSEGTINFIWIYFALPPTLGIAFTLFQLNTKPIRMSRVFGVTYFWAMVLCASFALYFTGTSVMNGTISDPFGVIFSGGASFIIAGIFGSFVAFPLAFLGALTIRFLTLKIAAPRKVKI